MSTIDDETRAANDANIETSLTADLIQSENKVSGFLDVDAYQRPANYEQEYNRLQTLKKLVNASNLGRGDIATGASISEDKTSTIRREQKGEVSEENRMDQPPKLPYDILVAQDKFKKESTRYFVLYGRGKCDHGTTPNSDM